MTLPKCPTKLTPLRGHKGRAPIISAEALQPLRPTAGVVRMAQNKNDRSAIGSAFEWVSRILAVSAEMVLPGLGGQWLDERWGSKYLALVGFAIGITLGIWHLLVMTRKRPRVPQAKSDLEDT